MSDIVLSKIYLSLYCKGSKRVTQGFTVRESWRPNRTAIYWPPLLWPSALCLSRSPDAQPEAHSAGFLYCILSPTGLVPKLHRGSRGPLLLGGGFPYHILSSTRLISNSQGVPRASSAGWWLSLPHLVSDFSDLQLTGFLSSPSYIIVQSLTQSLEWHVCSSSSGNNCRAVHRSLSSGASVYECTMGFLPCPIFQPARLRDFFSELPSECVTSFRCITLEWHVWPGRRSIYNTVKWLQVLLCITNNSISYVYP